MPNGRKPDDPHYVYKLDWLARLREAAGAWMDGQTALVGDWNICPTDDDVFDPPQFKNSTHVTPAERAAFQAFLDDGYAEVTRAHAPGYTYWDYYRQRFERDRGLRSTSCWRRPTLAARVTGAFIDREERAGRAPPTTPRWSSTSLTDAASGQDLKVSAIANHAPEALPDAVRLPDDDTIW